MASFEMRLSRVRRTLRSAILWRLNGQKITQPEAKKLPKVDNKTQRKPKNGKNLNNCNFRTLIINILQKKTIINGFQDRRIQPLCHPSR
jgi:hypothetical protein